MSYIEREKEDGLEPLIAPTHPKDGLSSLAIVGYSIGHVFNDLCAGVWFNFLLFYVTKVVLLPPQVSGLVMLSGQLADGFMTPLVGLCSDRTSTSCGKRTPWYIFGTLLVAPSFFGLFWECALCNVSQLSYQNAQMIYYITLPALFNIGWASVQISNLSIIAQLSLYQKRRDSLVGFRTAATYASNFLVLFTSLLIFLMTDQCLLGFQILDVSVTSLGLLCSVIYLILIPQVRYSRLARLNYSPVRTEPSGNPSFEPQNAPITWREWLSRCEVYIYGGVYMFSRMAINIFSSMTPFYLQEVLAMGGGQAQTVLDFHLALVPMIGYTFSSLSSVHLVKRLTQRFSNRLYPYYVGTLLLSLGMLPLFFLSPSFSWPIYLSSALIGSSFSLLLNISINCINDVVGSNPESGAFVFGFFSFLDKTSNGIVLFLISTYGLSSSETIRYETTLIALLCSYLGSLFLYFGAKIALSKAGRPKIEGNKTTQSAILKIEL